MSTLKQAHVFIVMDARNRNKKRIRIEQIDSNSSTSNANRNPDVDIGKQRRRRWRRLRRWSTNGASQEIPSVLFEGMFILIANFSIQFNMVSIVVCVLYARWLSMHKIIYDWRCLSGWASYVYMQHRRWKWNTLRFNCRSNQMKSH